MMVKNQISVDFQQGAHAVSISRWAPVPGRTEPRDRKGSGRGSSIRGCTGHPTTTPLLSENAVGRDFIYGMRGCKWRFLPTPSILLRLLQTSSSA